MFRARLLVLVLAVSVLAVLHAPADQSEAVPGDARRQQSIPALEASLGSASVIPQAFPGENGRLAFASFGAGNAYHVFTSMIDGGDLRELAPGLNPAWSPDGKEIAYTDTTGIWVMDENGANPQKVTTNARAADGLDWSPDGTRLVYSISDSTQSSLVVVDRSDGSKQTLQTVLLTEGQFLSPAWSPDGQVIAFAFSEETAPFVFEPDVWAIDADGSNLHRLTNFGPGQSVYYLDWSPAGTELAISLSKAGGSGVLAIDTTGAVIDTIRATNGSPASLAWSPDGKEIAFYHGPISIVGRDGSNFRTTSAGGISNFGLDWQPKVALVQGVEFTQGIQQLQSIPELQTSLGTSSSALPQAFPGENGKVVFSRSTGSSDLDLFVVDADGTGESPLITGPAIDSRAAWSPDGRQLAFVRQTTPATPRLMLADADGTNVRDVTTSNIDVPSWSPDGKKIAFARDGDIFAITLETGVIANLTNDAASQSSPKWSPLGDKIAYVAAASPTEIRVMPATGPAGPKLVEGAFPSWSPDGQRIAYRPTTGTIFELRDISINGGSSHHLTDTNAVGTLAIAWSPEGTEVAFADADTAESSAVVSIFAVPASGGARRRISAGPSDFFPDWQPKVALVSGVEFTQGIQELQTVQELKTSLAGSGEPPVPLIAGKPAAMRVYFGEVDTALTYTVEVNGEFTRSRTVTLQPGCTADQRRRQEAGCHSVDFYFTPPQGQWSVQLVVKDAGQNTVLDELFDFTSRDADDLTVKAVSVCDSQAGPGGTWICQDPSSLLNSISLTRRMFPTSDLKVIVTGDVVRQDESTFTQTIRWWGQINRDLDTLHTATDELFGQQGTEIYYYGVTRTAVPSGTLGAAYIDTRGAASKVSFVDSGTDFIPWVIGHEIGHAMGLDHTDTAAPPVSGTQGCWLGTRTTLPAYPYADNAIRSGAAPGEIEVGFDVANHVALPGELFFETMGYCQSTPPPLAPDAVSWITPFSTTELLSPAGPLSLDAAVPLAIPATAGSDYWLFSGTIDAQGAATLDPLRTVQGPGAPASGSGSFRIEVRDESSAVLFTRTFTPSHGHGSPSPGQSVLAIDSSFSELIPVQPGAATIQLFDGLNTPLKTVSLDGHAPVVQINAPEVSAASSSLNISWSVIDPDSSEHTFDVDYSADGGQTWASQALGLAATSLTLDPALLAGSENGMIRVTAYDGALSGMATSAPFVVGAHLPHGEIVGPNRSSFSSGDLIWLEAAAWDIDDGTLDDGNVTWTSNKDGTLGTGASLHVYDLSNGTHVITMTARDSDNNIVTDTITISVSNSPLVEGGTERTWGDNNCSSSVDPVDSLLALRFDAGQSTNTGECPAMGTPVQAGGGAFLWGDSDCSGTVDPIDSLKLLRFDSGLNAAQGPNCPPLGQTTSVSAADARRPSWARLAWGHALVR